MNQDLRLDDASVREVSPLFWPAPKGRAFDAVVGGLESSEFLRQSRIIAETWGKDGAATRYEEIAGTNHFTVIDALTDPDSDMVKRLASWRRLSVVAATRGAKQGRRASSRHGEASQR